VFELEPGTSHEAALREAALLRRCAHPRIVPLLGVAARGPLLLLAMQRMQGGSLRAALQEPASREALRWRRS
jgi:serine/threonine protein kinase